MPEQLLPAIALVELESIAEGIRIGDAMVKRAPVSVLYAGTVHPGKFLVLVGGDVASVEEAVAAARDDEARAIDALYLPHVHPDVVSALRGDRGSSSGDGEALGIFETATVCATLLGADRGLKEADVRLRGLHLADDLGGRAYCLLEGTVTEVEAGMAAATGAVAKDRVCGNIVIPQLSDEMRASLERAPRFADLVRRGGKP